MYVWGVRKILLLTVSNCWTASKRGPKPKFTDVACPNKDCSDYGLAGKGNVVGNGTYTIQSGRVRKYICRTCGTVFCDRTNTAFYDLRTEDETVVLALKLVMKGMSLSAIGEILEVSPDTVRRWVSRAADHCEEVDNVLLTGLDVPKVELDELWAINQKK